MTFNLQRFFSWPAEPKLQSRIIQAGVVVVGMYSLRALDAEILRLGYLAAFVFLGCYGVALGGVVYGFVLLIQGIRATLSQPPNGLLLSIMLIGPLLAWYIPEPPLREEIKLQLNQERYLRIIDQAYLVFTSGDSACIELSPEDKDLSFTCVLVRNNYAEFHVNRDVFSLVYSFDEQIPQNRSCYWDGYVRRKIDDHWYVCKEDIN